MNLYFRVFFLTCLGLFVSSFSLFSQNFGQTVRGTVLQEGSQQVIDQATVGLMQEDMSLQTTTDANGRFRFEKVLPGRYSLKVTKAGFESVIISDLVVNDGKASVEEIRLTPKVYEVESVDIAANLRYLDRPSARQLTVEESKRFAAVYFDPARLAASLPGVVQANDQANHLVVRANSPAGMLWRLEGVDIVNPNHLVGAGTFSDRPSLSGGGTIILSTQLLGNSTFYSGAFPAGFGNALSGVFDMNLRPGNNEAFEFQVQAGLIGIDLAAEGPLGKKEGASFLANYRYSTVGLLSQLGVDLGDEEINYQDFAFNLSFPTSKAGTFTLFGMGGNSFNNFQGQRADSLQEDVKSLQDIFYTSNMGAVGGSHQMSLGNKTFWRSSAALSGINVERDASLFTDTASLLIEEDRLTQVKLSMQSRLSHYINPRVGVEGGLYATWESDKFSGAQAPIQYEVDQALVPRVDSGTFWLIQPFVQTRLQLAPNLNLDLGLHAQYLTLNNAFALEPRINVDLSVNRKSSVRLAYGLHSQQQAPQVYFTQGTSAPITQESSNRNLGFTRAHHLILSYQQQFDEHFLFRVEPYWQSLFNVPISADLNETFSTLNYVEGLVPDSLINEGQGRNMGVEVTVEKLLARQYYFLVSGSLYDSKFTLDGDTWLDTRFNGRYSLAVTGGREFSRLTKSQKNKTWGINLRVIYAGGFRAYPIDLSRSREEGRTVFETSEGLTEQFADYFRTDLRITFKRNRPNFTRTFGIDIQNLTNTRNVAFQAYDRVADEVITRLQLGIIPLLSYRIEF